MPGSFTPSPSVGRPSPFVMAWAGTLRRGATVLDVACGSGRHLHALAGRGLQLCGVDRDAGALDTLRGVAETTLADLEAGPWPYADRTFDALIVTNYLWRPLLPVLARALAPGGLALMETFGRGHEAIGRPRNPDFLLQPGEWLDWAREHRLEVLAYACGHETAGGGAGERIVQRIAAVRPGGAGSPGTHPLPESAEAAPAAFPTARPGRLAGPAGAAD